MQKRRCFIRTTAAIAGLLAITNAVSAQNADTQLAGLDDVIRAEMAAQGVPGAAVAVVSGDRVLFAKAFGVASIETGVPVSTQMLFRIGPITRVFTSAAMLVLEEEGRIDVNAPISECINSVPAALLRITPHELLSETAGLEATDFMPGSRDELAIGRTLGAIGEMEMFTAPGQVYSRSALGYTVAAAIIEVAAAGPFADVVKSRVLDPIGMHTSTFRTTTAVTRPFALGHRGTGRGAAVLRPFPDNAAMAPAELMFSNVNELARFAIAFMGGGQIEGRNALTPGVIAKLSGRYAPVPSKGDGATVGYGLVGRVYRGVRLLEQSGSTAGFSAALRMAPDHQFAVIVLANREGVDFERTIETAMERLLPLGPSVAAKAAGQATTAADRKQLPGRYRNGSMTLEITDHASELTLVHAGKQLPIEKIGNARFAAAGSPAFEFTVVRGTAGRVRYLHANGRAYARIP